MQNDSFSPKLFQDFIVWQVELVCIVVETDTKETRNWQNPLRAEKDTSESISQIKIKGAPDKKQGNFPDEILNLQRIMPPLIEKKILAFSGYLNKRALSSPNEFLGRVLKKIFIACVV